MADSQISKTNIKKSYETAKSLSVEELKKS